MAKEAIRSCYQCGGIDVYRYNIEPIVEGSTAGPDVGAASTPELMFLRYELQKEVEARIVAEQKFDRLEKVVATMEVNFKEVIQDVQHLTDHLVPLENALRGATIALLPALYGCGKDGSPSDGSYGQFEGVVRPANPTPLSPESIRVFPSKEIFSSPTVVSSESHSPIPSLISDNSPSPVSVLSETKSLWQELAKWFRGGEDTRDKPQFSWSEH